MVNVIKILFGPRLACLCTTVTPQTQLIDKKYIFERST